MLGQLMKSTTGAVACVAGLIDHITSFIWRSYNGQLPDDVKKFRITF